MPGGLEIRVRAQPRARRAGLSGIVAGADGPRLRVAVAAPRQDGRATRAVQETLARALGVAPSWLVLTAGATAREKCFRAEGDPAVLAGRLEDTLGATLLGHEPEQPA